MDRLRLEELKGKNEKRAKIKAAASPGPWRKCSDCDHFAVAVEHKDGAYGYRVVESANQNNSRDFTGRDLYGVGNYKDADFITNARNDSVEAEVDELLKAVEDGQKENDLLREMLHGWLMHAEQTSSLASDTDDELKRM